MATPDLLESVAVEDRGVVRAAALPGRRAALLVAMLLGALFLGELARGWQQAGARERFLEAARTWPAASALALGRGLPAALRAEPEVAARLRALEQAVDTAARRDRALGRRPGETRLPAPRQLPPALPSRVTPAAMPAPLPEPLAPDDAQARWLLALATLEASQAEEQLQWDELQAWLEQETWLEPEGAPEDDQGR